MSDLGAYSFLPWLRQGLANRIQSADLDTGVRARVQVSVPVTVRGTRLSGGDETATIPRSIALFGPGDIIGIDTRAIVRVEPRHWTTNFEPNHLAHVEFYDEDFPWRYTPAAPDDAKGRLRPWLTLVLLGEDEFTEVPRTGDAPLPSVLVADRGVFPPADELWAWAHVHVNRSLAAAGELISRDAGSVLSRLAAVLNENPDLAYSRLMCPRKLAESTAYHAFLVPTFESGRRAGLGLEPGDVVATMSAWDNGPRPEAERYPYYHRWHFRTGTSGDFETLVRLLVPKPVDRRVGTREVDMQFPGSTVRGVDRPELGGVLKLGGALRPPTPVPPPSPDIYETWDSPMPRPLQEDLARLLNLPDDYKRSGDPDPMLAPPLYGRWHALTDRVLTAADGSRLPDAANWVHRLNLDPRFRIAAGFGTRVVQDQQEPLMDAAWSQVGQVLEARRRVRFGQVGVRVSQVWYERHVMPLLARDQQKGLMLVAPLQQRIVANGVTVQQALRTSVVQPTMTSTALRRLIRPRGRLVRQLPFSGENRRSALMARVNAREVSAAPPPAAPTGAITAEAAANTVTGGGIGGTPTFHGPGVDDATVSHLGTMQGSVFEPITPEPAPRRPAMRGPGITGPIGPDLTIGEGTRDSGVRDVPLGPLRLPDVIKLGDVSPEMVASLPGVANFVIMQPGAVFTPAAGADTDQAVRFKAALSDTFNLVQASAQAAARPPRASMDFSGVAGAAAAALDPARTIPRRVLAGIFVPPRIQEEIGDGFVEPMAYPVIDLPMYEPLKNLSPELFLPNINLIEPNSVTLLETNQSFIESYMVGLNHEFARELLWREYPTDQRGSTFRQFWDVRSFYAPEMDAEALREKLRDVRPLHRWTHDSALGDHDNREEGTEKEDELVLVVRGELLKRYPTAVIYAHRACWQRMDDGTAADRSKDPCSRSGSIDNSKERRLSPLTPEEQGEPPRSKVLTPLFEARIDPDIYFLGFDLTVAAARGGSGEHAGDDPGWFFVIKERPGEPRFGLDTEAPTEMSVWNDLSWSAVQPGPTGSHIQIASAPPAFPLVPPGPEDDEKTTQHQDDRQVTWSRDMSSAELAYILFQAPVLVAVHASEMLPK